jgi:outer membrane lipoprotein-sorting protein
MRTLKTGLLLVSLLLIASMAFAEADSKAAQMMDEVMQKARKIGSYSVDIKTETQMMGQAMVVDGHMVFKQPNKMHMTSTMNTMGGMTQEMYTTGDIVWTYMPSMKTATKLDLTKIKSEMPDYPGIGGTTDMANPLKGFAPDTVKYVEKKVVDGQAFHVFEVTPTTTAPPSGDQAAFPMMPAKMVFLMREDNGLPGKISMYTTEGNLMMEQTYSNLKTDISVNDSEFEFTPPEGTQIMDMTEGAMNMMKQRQGGQQQGGQ